MRNECRPPNSCCKDELPCGFDDTYKRGCLEIANRAVINGVVWICLLWSVIWLVMLVQICLTRYVRMRINRNHKWKKNFAGIKYKDIGDAIRVQLQELH